MDQQQPQHPEVPQPPVPPVQPPYVPPAGETYQPVAGQSPPGQVFGILSIVFPFVGLSIIGLIFGIISMNQAAKVHASKTLGIVGTILSAIFTLLGLAWLALMIFVVARGYSAAQQRSSEYAAQSSALQSVKTDASTVMDRAEAYYTTHATYPQTVSDFETSSDSSLKSLTEKGVTVGTTTPTTDKTIQYQACGKTGAVIVYYNPTYKDAESLYIGDGSASTCK